MRRYISYLLLSGATLIAVGASVFPTALKADADLAYESGQTFYFKAAKWDENSVNGNYTGSDGRFLENDPTLSKQPIEYIAETMRTRLDAFGITGYKVSTEGADTLVVTARVRDDSDELYTQLKDYLCFSGGDYELDATDTSSENYAHKTTWETVLDGKTAFISEWEQQSGVKIPTVVIPIVNEGENVADFKSLIDYCKSFSSGAEGEETTSSCNLVVWANRNPETDLYKDSSSNPNIKAKIFMDGITPTDAAYYESSDTEQTTPTGLRLIPQSSALSGGGEFTPDKAQIAYEAARSLMLTFNATAFQYDALKASSSAAAPKFHISYTHSVKASPSVEALMVNGANNREIATSGTFISILVSFVCIALLLAFFERSFAPMHLATMGLTMFGAFATYVAFGAPFNVAALIGLIGVGAMSLFATLYYSAKVKEELYKGRTLKKAHAEGVKRALWPTIDIGIIGIVLGVCIYGLAGDLASKAGVMLAVGGFFALIGALVFTRIAGWLLCNDSTLNEKFPKYIGVKKERIPNLANEEKQSFFGPFAERDFTRGKKISLIASCALIVCGIGAAIGWGASTQGKSFFNSSAYEASAPTLRIDVRSSTETKISLTSLSDTSKLVDPTFVNGSVPKDVFHYYLVDNKYLADYFEDVRLSSESKAVFVEDGSSGLTAYWFYYEITFKKGESNLAKAISNPLLPLSFAKWNDVSKNYEPMAIDNISDFSADVIAQFGDGNVEVLGNGAFSEYVVITFDAVTPAELTPYLWQVTLGVGIGLAALLLYFCLRYRPSRGIAATALVAGSSFVGVTFFILTRISTTPVVSLGAIAIALFASLLASHLLNVESDVYRDSKEKEKNTFEFRLECLKTAGSRSAHNLFLLSLLFLYTLIVFFAFGPRIYGSIFLAAILGSVLSLALALTAMPTLSRPFAKLFSKITIRRPTRKKKKKAGGQLLKKHATAEHEESIFIGIND